MKSYHQIDLIAVFHLI